MDCSSPGSSVLHCLLELAQIHVLWVGDAIQPSVFLCCPLLLLPSIFPSIRVFSNESALRVRSPKYWSFSVRASNEYSGLISFTIDWFDLLAAQGTLKSLLQHHSSKASILQHSAFFMVQLSHLYYYYLVVKSLSRVRLFSIPLTAAPKSFLSFTIFRGLLKLMSIESMIPYNHLILCCPLLLLPSIFPSFSVFSNESVLCIR